MRIKGLTAFFVRQPLLFWSAVAAVLIAGVLSFMQMPKLEDPDVVPRMVSVVIVWPGATAQEVELQAAQVVEDQLRTLPDVEEIRTECSPGMAQITVEFKQSVMGAAIEQHYDLLRRKMSDVQMSLPQDCYAPIVIDDMTDVYGLFYALVCDEGYTHAEMERYAKLIRRELLAVTGVKRVNIAGLRKEVVNITLSKDKLARNGLISTQIMMQLQASGKMVNAGTYKDDSDRIALRISHELKDENDIRNLLIKTTEGHTLRLGDVADVRRQYEEPQTGGLFVNGRQAVAICLALQNDVVVPDVGKAVDAKLAEVMHQVPVGMQTEKIFFQPDKVDEAVGSFMMNLLMSVFIVVVVLMFAMGFRSGLVIGFGLALTIAMSFPLLMMCGTTLQRISLGAFIVAMGMLVDNAIVIMDGILMDKQRGLGLDIYLYRIGQHTAMPLFGATLIAASAFLCVYLSPDSTGEYARDLFLVLCVSLLVSWVLALVQVPVCVKQWMPAKASETKEGQYDSKIHNAVRRVIILLLDHKAVSICTAVVLLVLCTFGFGKVNSLFFPDFDYSQFVVEYQLPSQASPERVRHDLLEMSEGLLKHPKIDRVTAAMGGAPVHYCLVRPMTAGNERYGELMIDCPDYNAVCEVIGQVRDSLRNRYPDAYIRFRKYNFSIATSHTVEAQFRGSDPTVLRRLCSQAEEVMRRAPHADAYSVQSSWYKKGKALTADYCEQLALNAGVSREDLGNALLAATDGLPVGVLSDNDHQVVVQMHIRNEDGSRITDLADIPVWSTLNVNIDADALQELMAGSVSASDMQDGIFKCTSLAAVAPDIRLGWEEQYITRTNGQRSIEAECDPDFDLYRGTPAQVMEEIQADIEAIPLPEGYSLRWMGDGKTSGEANRLLLKYMPLTVFIVLTILLLLFRDWREVIIVLLCLPFVLCGITPALLLLRQPFTFMALIGVMGLMGMMLKNAIVLVGEINRLYKEEHLTPYNAVLTATVSRVRPVVLASLTTILGMIPLLDDPMYGAMAVSIMAGLAVGTLITLVLLPVLYATFFHVTKPQYA